MSTGNPQFDSKPSLPSVSEKIQSQQEILWEQKRKEIDEIVDALGAKIDGGIKDTIVALNLHGITTAASCEGHPEVNGDQRPWPWVLVQASNEPEERFVGETQALENAAKMRGITLEELKGMELYWDIKKQISDNPLTPEYQIWEEKNHELHIKVSMLLEEFYVNRQVDENIKLKAEEEIYPFYGTFDIESVADRDFIVRFLNNELTNEEKRELLELLPRRQKEMQDFTAFLKNKFLHTKNK